MFIKITEIKLLLLENSELSSNKTHPKDSSCSKLIKSSRYVESFCVGW